MNLGKWALIDIETTGTDPQGDLVIDLGFLQFEGIKLVKTHSSLIHSERKLSHFIQKLTGITDEMLLVAPPWRETEMAMGELEGHQLLAHNSSFEESFLGKYFEGSHTKTEFQDTLLFLGLLFVDRSSLSLESFIVDFGISQNEQHRGLADSVDLLKVLLVSCALCLESKEFQHRKKLLFNAYTKYKLKEMWCFKLLDSPMEDLLSLAKTIDFDLKAKLAHTFTFFEKENSATESPDSDENNCPEDASFFSSLEFSGESVKSLWRHKNLNRLFPSYTHRKEQEQLSLRVGQSFKNSVHAIIQAPTGTGKTLGYLVPAGLFSLAQKSVVLVATGTKTLQHQIIKKDIPQLKKILGSTKKDLKVRSLVGSQNHLCELLFRHHGEEDLLMGTRPFHERYGLGLMEVIFGLNDVLGKQIKRGDIPYVLKKLNESVGAFEKNFAVDFRACIGKKCPHKGSCTYLEGLREAREADIIVGNHSLMFQWPKGISRPKHIIVDEAHKLEKEVSEAFKLETREGEFTRFVQSLEHLQGLGALFYLLNSAEDDSTELIAEIRETVNLHARALQDHLPPFRDVLERYFQSRSRYSSLYWNEAPMLLKNRLNDELSQSIYNYLENLAFIIKDLYDLITPHAQSYCSQDLKDENALLAFTKFESFYATLEQYHLCFQQLMKEDSKYASSFSYHEEYGFALTSVPIDVGEITYEQLLQGAESVIFTSATLGNADGSLGTRGMEWPLGHTYLPPEQRYRSGLFLPPLYDYENHAKVFLCDDVPPMNDKSFVPSVLEPVMELIKKLKGRSLLLFSSRVRFEMAREVLLKTLSHELPLFIQGMGNNVVEDYRKNPEGILMGMETFGEGIDLPGESLQFVLIDKIPDLRQDVVIQKRREFFESAFGNEFVDYFLSHRTRSLSQKLGRLLRRDEDRGGAIIVDGRIKRWKGKTIKEFTELTKPYHIHRSPLRDACAEISDFLLPYQN